MAHLTAPRTKSFINEVEVVSDDSTQVLKFYGDADGVTISLRDATDSNWSAKRIATLDRRSAEVIATILQGGQISEYGSVNEAIKGLTDASHQLERPETVEPTKDSDCTALDIERAKAENLKEERRNIELSMERDHALDKHVGYRIDGCPACERAIYPGHGDGSLTTAAVTNINPELGTYDEV